MVGVSQVCSQVSLEKGIWNLCSSINFRSLQAWSVKILLPKTDLNQLSMCVAVVLVTGSCRFA